jgi:hypothetical protein
LWPTASWLYMALSITQLQLQYNRTLWALCCPVTLLGSKIRKLKNLSVVVHSLISAILRSLTLFLAVALISQMADCPRNVMKQGHRSSLCLLLSIGYSYMNPRSALSSGLKNTSSMGLNGLSACLRFCARLLRFGFYIGNLPHAHHQLGTMGALTSTHSNGVCNGPITRAIG